MELSFRPGCSAGELTELILPPGDSRMEGQAGPDRPGEDGASEWLAVSVIIPCRNEVRYIDRCLSSVFAFEPVPGGFEVIVVDGESDDGTQEKLAAWQRARRDFRVLSNPARVVPVALNLGIRAARGRLIMRIDAHSEYRPDYLRLGLETSHLTGADNVGGLIETVPADETLSARLVQYMTTHRFGVGNSRFRVGTREGAVDTVPFGCFRRDVFSRIGWFDERLARNQDYEFNRRLLRSGGNVWCNPLMLVTYYNRSGLGALLAQAWRTAMWNAWMWYLAPYSFAVRHATPGLFVAGLLSLAAGASFTVARFGLAAVIFLYLTIAGTVAFRHARREAPGTRALLAGCFFLYHASYGLGTLIGVASLLVGVSPVQRSREPWPGAGQFRAWPNQRAGAPAPLDPGSRS
jgi:glycosyltransferase involved in cell wall biosynthesis